MRRMRSNDAEQNEKTHTDKEVVDGIMGQEAFWTKDFICCALICFFINMGMYITMVVVVGYATDALGANTTLAGFASGAFIVGAFWGVLSLARA